MGLVILVLGLAVFVGIHWVTTARDLRQSLIDKIGLIPYKALFSLVAILGVALIAEGFALYRAAGPIAVWHPPAFMRHITVGLMLVSIICAVAAYIPGNIKRVLKHPFLVGVKLWAFAHLLSNGDLGAIILFGSILGWAVFDRISLKSRSDIGGPPIPVGGTKNDIAAVFVGVVVYLSLGLVFHPLVIGVPVFGQ